MTQDIKRQLREYVVETFLFGEGGDDLSDDASLMEKGIVDSTGVLEIVAFLEEKYNVSVEDSELVPENFDSLNALSAFVARKQGAA